MGLRRAGAWQQGVDEDVVQAAFEGRIDDLDPRRAAAVAVADAYLGSPADTDWAALTAELSPDEVAALVLRLTLFSRNKVRVALGFDADEIRPREF